MLLETLFLMIVVALHKLNEMLCLDWVHIYERDKWVTWAFVYAETKLSPEASSIFDEQK